QEKRRGLEHEQRRDLEGADVEHEDCDQRQRKPRDLRPELADRLRRPELQEIRGAPEAACRPEPHFGFAPSGDQNDEAKEYMAVVSSPFLMSAAWKSATSLSSRRARRRASASFRRERRCAKFTPAVVCETSSAALRSIAAPRPGTVSGADSASKK